MNIEFLIEDYSGGEALEALLPRCLEPGTEYQVRRFSGKRDLLKKLPQRLKGYREWITEDGKLWSEFCRKLATTLVVWTNPRRQGKLQLI